MSSISVFMILSVAHGRDDSGFRWMAKRIDGLE